jgi:hypothetical protein
MRLHTKKTMQRAAIGCILATLAFGGLTGCHAHYVEADIKNNSGAPVSLVELDYPSASFGSDSLASGASYHYRFKILGSGPAKVLWTDAQHHDHSVSGPSLQEGQEGTMTVTITAATATWQTNLRTQ